MNTRFLLPLLFSLLFFSCVSDRENIPSVDHIDIDFDLVRFEKAFDETDDYETLINTYPNFGKLYFNRIMNFIDPQSKEFLLENINEFKTDSIILDLEKRASELYGDKSKFSQMFEDPLKRMKLYFPDVPTPSIYTFISGLAYQGFIFDDQKQDGLAIGLDFYLGEDFPYSGISPQNPNFSRYFTRAFNKDHVVKKAMETWVDDHLGEAKGNRLIDHMIHKGKKLYVLESLLPTLSDTIIHEYSKKQMSWCQQNQSQMWSYFFDKELFYETNLRKINKLIDPAPTTSGMPPDSPGRTANFMGLQIVKNFMRRNKDITIPELIAMDDAQYILDKAKYKP